MTHCRGAAASAVVFAGVLLSGAVQALEVVPLWTAQTHMVMESSPMVVDLNGDGDAEVVTAAYENLIAVDGDGQELWRFDTRARYSTCVAVLERAGQTPLLFAGDNSGLLTCVDGAGNVVWQVEGSPVFCSSAALADLDGDGALELVQGDKAGNVTAYDAANGTIKWKATVEGECASPAVGDLNGDSALEIVIATSAGKIFTLDAKGNLLWIAMLGGSTPDWGTCSPVVFMDSTDQPRVACASGEGQFFCLDGGGQVIWQRSTRGNVASSICAGDFDSDGHADVFAVTQLGVIYRLAEDGRVLWDIDTQGRSLAPGAIIDLDGDGALEYVLGTQNGAFLVFGQDGTVRFHHQFENRTINMTPAFGEIVKDRPGLEMAVTGGETGQLFCFGTPAALDTAAQWQSYRGDNRLSGARVSPLAVGTGKQVTRGPREAAPHPNSLPPGKGTRLKARMTPKSLKRSEFLVGGTLAFQITGADEAGVPLVAEARCLRPDGSVQAALSRIAGDSGEVQMAMSVPVSGKYDFAWALRGPTGAAVVSGKKTLKLSPYANDHALAARAMREMDHLTDQADPTGPSDKTIAAALRREAQAIAKELQALAPLQGGAVPGVEVEQRTAALNTRAQRARALAKLTGPLLRNAPETQVIAFEGKQWENRDVHLEMPDTAAERLKISRRCVPGEHQPVSVKLFNVTAVPVAVTCRTGAGSEAVRASVFAVKGVPTNQNLMAWDPMLPLDASTLEIPPLETREVWVDVDLGGVQPGLYAVPLVIDAGGSQAEVEISLEVLPFEMAGFGAMRLVCWASYNDAVVRDLLAHGNNVFITSLPPATTPTIDFNALDKFIEPLAGQDVFLLLQGAPALGAAVEDQRYVGLLRAYLDEVFAHLAAKGFDEQHIGLYTLDEPGGNGWTAVRQYVEFGRQALKARPGIQFYVNGGGDLPMFEALNEIAGIWSPSFYMLPEHTPEMAFVRSTGKTLWSYDCGYAFARPVGWNTKTINVVAQYRLAAISGFNFGATGVGFWCYNIGPSMWEADPNEFPLVYTNADGSPTVCRRWEAVREGMEDTRILIALREKLRDPATSTGASEKIEHLLENTVPGMCNQALEQARYGAARYVIDASNNDGAVERLRDEMMDCIDALRR
ncbi:MAG: PQQ-binding-like beta-propeller repeat protein [Candidatus Hydrogenedentes bacterium]|nr:PQQ-binding-like beta-propeller repeat protein [Candidatus Hydrogenedentota bacterium]